MKNQTKKLKVRDKQQWPFLSAMHGGLLLFNNIKLKLGENRQNGSNDSSCTPASAVEVREIKAVKKKGNDKGWDCV